MAFGLDGFQQQACAALESGHGVLVCAPTGAGKTVVGEFAVHLALAAGGKCFYTTPLKALSNQKHTDFVARYGKDQIGLLTGDLSVNANAPVVVMTTEVLRNMLYADSPVLQGLSYVVMDEVHFLADRMRGAVWEEVILHLPDEVRLVSLSATVSNAEEFGGWIQTVRGDTTVVVDDHRPVPLWQHMLVGKRIFDLFDYDADGAGNRRQPIVDPNLLRHIAHRREADRLSDWRGPRRQAGRGGPGRSGRPGFYRPPSRPDVIAHARRRGPAAGDHLRVLPGRLRRRGRAVPAVVVAADHRGGPGADRRGDRPSLRRPRRTPTWPCSATTSGGKALLRGIAAHHAGLLPVFRHTVEELFTAGLIKAVFATETLALGINMPARTVVLERLVKFNGEQHVPLTPGEYTQLTGRAGRRGIDVEGHAVVLWHPGENTSEPAEVAGLASTRTFPLRSSFAPSYNMTINLVNRVGPEQAHRLLEQSFAQYQADRSVVSLVRGVERGQRMLDEVAAELGGQRRADPRVRPAAGADQPARARPGPRIATATPAGGQRRAGGAASRRHHHDHPRPPGRPGGRAGTRPRQRRPAAVGVDRKPLGRTDFVGRLFRRVGAGGLDDIAQAGRTPTAPGPPRFGFGATFGRCGIADFGRPPRRRSH